MVLYAFDNYCEMAHRLLRIACSLGLLCPAGNSSQVPGRCSSMPIWLWPFDVWFYSENLCISTFKRSSLLHFKSEWISSGEKKGLKWTFTLSLAALEKPIGFEACKRSILTPKGKGFSVHPHIVRMGSRKVLTSILTSGSLYDLNSCIVWVYLWLKPAKDF